MAKRKTTPKKWEEDLQHCTPQPQSNANKSTAVKKIAPKSINQKQYLEAIEAQDMVFGIGVAGTGKTFLAMAMAVSYLLQKKVKRIVLVRPAVEAGEKLGFLPGTMQEKVDPYLRPLYDALYFMVEPTKAEKLLEEGAIEVAPLAFMRGRTLTDAFVIMDEAQNATYEQMKMLLTRLGEGSKAVITGDITQIDLPSNIESGLEVIHEILGGVEGIHFSYFEETDVVRSSLVKRVVHAFEVFESKEG